MEYEDRLVIATPEGVELELTLAGVGSRFVSALIDFVIEGALIAALAGVLFATLAPELAAAGIALGAFALIWGYHVLFETLASGRSPGKRAAGLRVVRAGGAPVRLRSSAVRNLIRIVDLLPPVTYGVGAVSILATGRNQRLGDLAAGTLVVRVRRAADQPGSSHGSPPPPVPTDPSGDWDVSGVGEAELSPVRRFLERRHTLEPAARARLAADLATRIRPRVLGAPPDEADEAFLQALVAAKRARR